MTDREGVLLPRQMDENLVVHESEFREDSLKKIIRDLGLKVTQQRILILRAFCMGRRHATAQELYEKVSLINANIGFATVYRFLRSLSDSGYAIEVRVGGHPARYEMALRDHHDHMTCTECGHISEFENKAIETLQVKVAQQLGFQLTHHVLELYGVCFSCQNSGNGKA